jgi:hypothetical protein
MASDEQTSFALEPLDGRPVVPVVGGLLADTAGDRLPGRRHRRAPCHPGHPAGLGQQVGRPDHHLGRHAPPVGAFPADQLPVDADHFQARLGQLAGHFLTARSHADHHHVDPIAHRLSSGPVRPGHLMPARSTGRLGCVGSIRFTATEPVDGEIPSCGSRACNQSRFGGVSLTTGSGFWEGETMKSASRPFAALCGVRAFAAAPGGARTRRR